MAGSRYLNVRYPGACASCGTALTPGMRAWWDVVAKELECGACRPELAAPGAGAQRAAERRRTNRDRRTREAHPILGGVLMAVRERPQHEQAWFTGAEGERRLGLMLEGLSNRGVTVLHDRTVMGSKANIDHIAVAPTGIYVIDAKLYAGKRVEVRSPMFGRSELRVGGRDRTKLVEGMAKQIATVREALEFAVPVTPVVCFLEARWELFGSSFQIGGVRVCSPKALRKLITKSGPLRPDAAGEAYRSILRSTRPA